MLRARNGQGLRKKGRSITSLHSPKSKTDKRLSEKRWRRSASRLEMAIFNRPDNSYLVGVATSAEMMNDIYFLDYANGEWKNISADDVPRKKYLRTSAKRNDSKHFCKKVIDKGDDYEVSDKGEPLYEPEWKNGKFAVKK